MAGNDAGTGWQRQAQAHQRLSGSWQREVNAIGRPAGLLSLEGAGGVDAGSTDLHAYRMHPEVTTYTTQDARKAGSLAHAERIHKRLSDLSG
jgi:hypothetical protein